MVPTRFRVLADSKLEPSAKAGTIVYAFHGCDYGLARDDTYAFGVEHVSVTLSPDNVGTPSFTMPRSALEAIEDKPDAPPPPAPVPRLSDAELVRHLDTFTMDGKTFQETMESWGFRFEPNGCVAVDDQHAAFHLQGVFTDRIQQAHAEGRL